VAMRIARRGSFRYRAAFMVIGFYLVVGLAALYFGAGWLVRGSASLARRLGISPLLVGLTVVGYGTSAPEMIVSLVAAWRGQAGLALGNAVGSNVFNIGFILGLTAILCPIRVHSQLARHDAPIMALVAGAFLLMFQDAVISRWEAIVLVLGLAGYLSFHIRLALQQSREEQSTYENALPNPSTSLRSDLLLIVAVLGGLALGSHFFVEGAVALATIWGVSEAVVGLTVVAAGTGLPELAASFVAALRRQSDLAIGNIVGSNIYNLLGIVGIAGCLAGPLEGQSLGLTEVIIMAGISMLLLPLAWTGLVLRRAEGILLMLVYAGYLAHLWPR